MKCSSELVILTLSFTFTITSGQMTHPQAYVGPLRPLKPLPSPPPPPPPNVRPEIQPIDTMRTKQLISVQSPLRGQAIRLTVHENSLRYAKLENMIGLLDRVAYIISRPVAIINVLKFCALAVSSLIMSLPSFPLTALDLSKRRNRDRFSKYNPLGQITRSDIEALIEFMSRNYDDTLDRAGFTDREKCRERSLCVLGDMMACEFPNFVVTVGRFTKQYLPPIDVHKNKYTEALILGLNQTDCDQAYEASANECPTFRDYARSYFYAGTRRRRDHLHHWRDQ